MSLRAWLHQSLSSDLTLIGLMKGGFHEAGSLIGVPNEKPFLVHRLMTNNVQMRDDVQDIARNQYASIWIHDWPGDYEVIDQALDRIALILPGLVSGKIMSARWLENSPDLNDSEMGTIARYARYYFIHTP